MVAVAPALTIGLPVFNGARFLREALESLLAQSFRDFELLISDNASTDATAEICRDYAARDARIRYVRQAENIGLFPNVDFVMRNARGRYFMLVGDDDVYEPEYAAALVPALEADPGLGLMYADFGYIREDGTPVAGGTSIFLDPSWSRARNLGLFLLKRPVLPMIMGVFRTDVVRGALPFVSFGPMIGSIDLVFMARALAAARAGSVRRLLFRYRLKDRASSFPADWPRTWLGQRWYLLRINARVTAEMCRAIVRSDLSLAARGGLAVFALLSLAEHILLIPAIEAVRARRAAVRA